MSLEKISAMPGKSLDKQSDGLEKNAEKKMLNGQYERGSHDKVVVNHMSIEDSAQGQEALDSKVVESILDTFMEIPEMLEISSEKAETYKRAYLEEFGRKTPMPTEQEQLVALQEFVDSQKIEEYKQQLFNAVKNPSSFLKRLKALAFFHQTKRIEEEINNELELEREAKLNSSYKESGFSENGDNQGLIIIGERVWERMHGVDRGNYVHAADQFGREYFTGPDTDTHHLAQYANVLAKYFNVNKVVTVRYPVALEGSYHAYKSELKEAFISQKVIRKLVESSKLVDSTKMLPEDCDRIDPMPVADLDKSFVSSVAINLLTGAADRIVKWSILHSKNYDVRKDGVYYLYDMEGGYNEKFVEEQLIELEQFLNQTNNKNELIGYLTKTAVFLSCLPITDNIYFAINNHYAKFPKRLYDKIEMSVNISKGNKKLLLNSLRSEVKNVM